MNVCMVYIFWSFYFNLCMSFYLKQLWSIYITFQFSSVQSLSHVWLCNPMYCMQHIWLSCSSPIPRACSNSCPSNQWCLSTISSSVIPFSSCLQYFPESQSFSTSRFFLSGDQSFRASASVLPMNIQDWFPLGLTGWIFLQSKGLSKVFSNTTVQNH